MMRAVNVRRLLAIPETYLGNTIVYAIDMLATSATYHLGTVAQNLRASLEDLRDSGMVHDALELANNIPDVRNLGLSFPIWAAGNMVLSSLSRLPVSDWDFGCISHGGLGKMEIMRFRDKWFEGITFTMPQRPDGSLEIIITMKAPDMERLKADQVFIEFFKFVSQ
ncbi:Cytochrome P450 82A2 [Penicillium paradoxum]|uniref:Cytochrome P450 82A2 n=1 Tax=Penicillium paradoxum TaxID=176176 RepID=UPI0025466BDB|nr:Cytochrome P450 82A2 [Penicillium paradoxum]KAJ5787196.1 Cytochrome P450 82A2 [Penicillium paradoxum]